MSYAIVPRFVLNVILCILHDDANCACKDMQTYLIDILLVVGWRKKGNFLYIHKKCIKITKVCLQFKLPL
jgi:hypothetical protein